MIANDVIYIKAARRSGLAMRSARWAKRLVLLAQPPDCVRWSWVLYTTPICCPHGSLLPPRQRYVRRQSDQKTNWVYIREGKCPLPLS